MKRKRFSVEQIVAIVKQAEMGMPVAELIRRVGISGNYRDVGVTVAVEVRDRYCV